MRKRLVLGTLCTLVALLLAATLALRAEYEAETLRDAVVSRLAASLDVPIEAGRCRVRPLEGLVLEDVVASPNIPGGRCELTIDALVLEMSLLTFLFDEDLKIERLRFINPSLVVHEPKVKPPPPKPPAPTTPPPRRKGAPSIPQAPPPKPEPPPAVEDGLSFLVAEVLVEGGSLALTREGGGDVATLEGLSLHLRDLSLDLTAPSLARGLSASGDLSLSSAALEVGHLGHAEGRVTLKQGALRVEDLVFSTSLGDFEASWETNFLRTPFVTSIDLKADPFDLHQLVESPDSGAFGGASFELSARGKGTDPEGMQGRGTLKMTAGLLPWFPLLGELETALKRLSLYELEYEAVEARFDLVDGRLLFDPFKISTEGMWVEVEGFVSLGGELALDLVLRADKSRVDRTGIPEHIRKALEVEGGHWSVPARVTGTAEEPIVSASVDVLVSRLAERGETVDEASLRRDLQGLFARGGT